MKLFKLTSANSTMKLTLDQPIHLDEDGNYSFRLVSFYSHNFIANISDDLSNSFRFSIGRKGLTFTIFCSYYSVVELKRFVDCLKTCIDEMPPEEKIK